MHGMQYLSYIYNVILLLSEKIDSVVIHRLGKSTQNGYDKLVCTEIEKLKL